jgi:hypothetical protein
MILLPEHVVLIRVHSSTAGHMKLDLFSTILIRAAFESALHVGRRDDAMWVLIKTHAGHVPHLSHHHHRPVRRQDPWLCLLLALLHDLLVATLLEVSDYAWTSLILEHCSSSHRKVVMLRVYYPSTSMSISR